jgi:hypothetical protein
MRPASYYRAYYRANKERILRRNREWDNANKAKVAKCHSQWRRANKAKVRESERRYHQKNAQKRNELNRVWRAALKAEIILAYGGKCRCCGESEPKFLTVDHTENDGHKHRLQIGNGGMTTYRWLRKNGFPKKGFQLLCFNCNLAKSFFGACPHTEAL